MRALIDSDILIDVAIDREPFVLESSLVLMWCEMQPGQGAVAWHSVANLFYIVRKELGAPSTRLFIEELLKFMEVVANGTAGVRHALALPISDFEDAMQVAVAMAEGVNSIVTRNVADFQNSPVPAILPAKFLVLTRP